jgi:hypothetical protein
MSDGIFTRLGRQPSVIWDHRFLCLLICRSERLPAPPLAVLPPSLSSGYPAVFYFDDWKNVNMLYSVHYMQRYEQVIGIYGTSTCD